MPTILLQHWCQQLQHKLQSSHSHWEQQSSPLELLATTLITIHWQPQLATTLIPSIDNHPDFQNFFQIGHLSFSNLTMYMLQISPFDNVCSCISPPLTTKTKGSPETLPELGTLSESQPTDIQSIQLHL